MQIVRARPPVFTAEEILSKGTWRQCPGYDNMHSDFFTHLNKGLAWLAVFFTRLMHENGCPKPGDLPKSLHWQNLEKTHRCHTATS